MKLRPGLDLTGSSRGGSGARSGPRPPHAHVPAVILPVEDIPYTISGKKVELAVRRILHGEPVTNRDALANPGALDLYRDLVALRA